MKAIVLTLMAIILLLGTACGLALVAVTIPNLDDVTEALGYSLAPACMPEEFEFHLYEVVLERDEPTAWVVYRELNHHIFIMYPQSFPSSVSDDFLLESLGIEWCRPDDAVSEVKVNGKAAYIVRGSWSAESLQKLGNPDPEALATYTPGWDYDMYLSLFFDFELSQDEMVGVMMRAMLYPNEWITSNEMVKIAESLQRVD
jgi:hypothetical protein